MFYKDHLILHYFIFISIIVLLFNKILKLKSDCTSVGQLLVNVKLVVVVIVGAFVTGFKAKLFTKITPENISFNRNCGCSKKQKQVFKFNTLFIQLEKVIRKIGSECQKTGLRKKSDRYSNVHFNE